MNSMFAVPMHSIGPGPLILKRYLIVMVFLTYLMFEMRLQYLFPLVFEVISAVKNLIVTP